MSVRAHLRLLHTNSASFHTEAAKAHTALAKCFGKSDVEGASDAAAAHESLAKAHMDAAEQAVTCCKSLDASHKAMGADDDDRIQPFPEGISVVYKQDTPTNVRAVPRTGAPNIGNGLTVPLQFAHLVKVNEED